MHVVEALVSAWWPHQEENALLAFLRFMARTSFPLMLFLGRVPVPSVGAAATGQRDGGRSLTLLPYLRHTRILRWQSFHARANVSVQGLSNQEIELPPEDW
ncbi:hypothetical protein AB0M72_19955 [Nocardiopsis dassonvillei]